MADQLQPRPYDRHQDRDLGHSVLRDHHVQADAHTGLSDHGRTVIPPDEHPERHEQTDVSVRGIVYTAAGIAGITLLTLIFILVLQRNFLEAQKEDNARARRTSLSPARQFPPDDVPMLQGLPGYHPQTPAHDMDLLRARNTRELSSYGYKPDGTAYIPVSRAMELALEQNLFPARQRAPGAEPTTRQTAGTRQGALQTPQPQGGAHESH